MKLNQGEDRNNNEKKKGFYLLESDSLACGLRGVNAVAGPRQCLFTKTKREAEKVEILGPKSSADHLFLRTFITHPFTRLLPFPGQFVQLLQNGEENSGESNGL